MRALKCGALVAQAGDDTGAPRYQVVHIAVCVAKLVVLLQGGINHDRRVRVVGGKSS